MTEPLTPFSSIKTDLLAILRERYPEGLPNSASPTKTPIPESIHEVSLAVPIDSYEPEKGWTELATNPGDIRESPRSLGLKDGALIAFAFIEGEGKNVGLEFKVEWSSYEAEYGVDGDGHDAMADDKKTLVDEDEHE